MKLKGLCLGLVLASVATASAQVAVEVTLEQHQFLSGESLPVTVRITNRSGQALRLGADSGWLAFAVEGRDGLVASKIGDPPLTGEFVVESSKVAVIHVDLSSCFALTQQASYKVVATVRIKAWDRELTSSPATFDIIEGARLWEQDIGVPNSAGATSALPEVRRYVLQQANYLKGQVRLYLCLSDPRGTKVFRVFPLGPMVSFGRPEPQIDKNSNLHVLYQNGPSSFSYTICNPDGEIILRQTYDYSNTRPKLRQDAAGNISVAGGRRRTTADDIPPAAEETTTNAVPPPAH